MNNLYRKIMWFDKRIKFELDSMYDALQSKRVVSDDPRYISGEFYSAKCDRTIQYESGLELEFIKMLEGSKRVKFYFEQPIKIPYWRGRKRLTYTPDFGIYLKTQEFILA